MELQRRGAQLYLAHLHRMEEQEQELGIDMSP